jgi:DGQHR domain-containing protein
MAKPSSAGSDANSTSAEPSETVSLPCIEVKQGAKSFYLFACKASELWSFSEINRRAEDKDEGYQRVLSASRVKQIKNFIEAGNAVPGAIIISFDNASYDGAKLSFEHRPDAAWILDGQHRSAAAHEAAKDGLDIDLPVVAFAGLDVQEQTDYFVTINKEARSVPSSLYIDLLKHLPKKKTEKEILEERVADISRIMSRDPESVFFQRIVSTTLPSEGQVSLTNFARVLRPHIHPTTGILGTYTLNQQVRVIENYFEALRGAFPKVFASNLFFRTVAFGGVFRALPVVFSASLAQSSAFRVSDAQKILELVQHFNFDGWKELGSGSQAERVAGDDLIAEIKEALEADDDSESLTLD